MPTNDFLPFGTAAGANVTDQTTWNGLAARTAGFSAGVASSAQINKALRQAGFVASAIAQFVADNQAGNVADDGIIANFEAQFLAALKGAQPGRLINVRTFTLGSSTYTPTTGTKSVVVEVVGGGGAGGGAAATGSGQISAGAGGSGGGYARSYLTTGFSGVTVTVGAGGVAVNGGTGGNGLTSSFGALLSGSGGGGGTLGGAQANSSVSPLGGSTGGIGSGGNLLNTQGGHGLYALYSGVIVSGTGGASAFGAGASPQSGVSGGNGASSVGAGGSGGVLNVQSGSSAGGGNGAQGAVIVYEYA